MSTDAMLHFGTLNLSADGQRAAAELDDDGCCADPLCVPLCDTACSFIDLMPEGPLWDRAKIRIREQLAEGGDLNPCLPLPECDPDPCFSMVNFGLYGARVLHDMVSNILWPSIRESSPYTAVTTLDDWLDRYGWEDCYRQHCRTVFNAELSPYEFEGDCGPEYCPPEFGADFECALKYATLVALTRSQHGVIKNLDGINFVIEPLGAVLRPLEPFPEDVQKVVDGECDDEIEEEGPPCFCEEVQLEICNTGDTLPGCPSLSAPCGQVVPSVPARQQYRCAGQPAVFLYPGVIAAECIARSLLTRKCPNIIHRCEEN